MMTPSDESLPADAGAAAVQLTMTNESAPPVDLVEYLWPIIALSTACEAITNGEEPELSWAEMLAEVDDGAPVLPADCRARVVRMCESPDERQAIAQGLWEEMQALIEQAEAQMGAAPVVQATVAQ